VHANAAFTEIIYKIVAYNPAILHQGFIKGGEGGEPRVMHPFKAKK